MLLLGNDNARTVFSTEFPLHMWLKKKEKLVYESSIKNVAKRKHNRKSSSGYTRLFSCNTHHIRSKAFFFFKKITIVSIISFKDMYRTINYVIFFILSCNWVLLQRALKVYWLIEENDEWLWLSVSWIYDFSQPSIFPNQKVFI